MPTCITPDLKAMLLNMIKEKADYSIMNSMVNFAFPLCGEGVGAGVAAAAAKVAGKKAENWPNATLHLADGKTISGAPSRLFKDHFDLSTEDFLDEVVCVVGGDGESHDCRALSIIENWQGKGFIVKGDGEMAPTIKPGMGHSGGGDVDLMYKNWKEKLIKENKELNIYDPKSPDIQVKT